MIREYLMYGLGAALSIAAMFALDNYRRPVFDPKYDEREYATATGTLQIRKAGLSSELPLMTAHVVARDLETGGRSYKVRELLLRAAAPNNQQPSIESYVDLSRIAADLATPPHDFQVLVQSELPILLAGRLGARASRVLLEGTQPRNVITGSLLLTEISLNEAGVQRAEGRLELQVESDHGVEMITGRIDAQIVWD